MISTGGSAEEPDSQPGSGELPDSVSEIRAVRMSNHDSSGDPTWQALPGNIRQAVDTAWSNGMPPLASAIHARWWQLESWLRSLVYVELRAALGNGWVAALPEIAETRQKVDSDFRYMATPDAQNRLAYADVSTLFKITLERWEQFSDSLLAKNVWAGRIEELKAIRNRIGHCRRPHADDLARLEQTLRDLEAGAFAATSAFNDQSLAREDWKDAVTKGWLRGEHETASRLIEHARRQYDTIFQLRYSRRPWAAVAPDNRTIAGEPGYIWHAYWYFRGGRPFDLARFWHYIDHVHDLVLLVCADTPSSLSISFAAKEDPQAVADAIGYSFDSALMSLGRGPGDNGFEAWRARYADIDARVHVSTPWSSIEEAMRNQVSIFGAWTDRQ